MKTFSLFCFNGVAWVPIVVKTALAMALDSAMLMARTNDVWLIQDQTGETIQLDNSTRNPHG